jgi:hypothetical protein
MKGTPADFSFSRAVREWCFVQLPLLDVARFRKEAKSRGLSDLGLFDRDAWETLDREEILVPVAYARHGMWQHDMVGCLADGDLAVREEVSYRPWAQLCEEAEAIGQDAAPQVLYHHWQLFWLTELQDCLTPAVAWSQLGEGLDDFFAARAKIGAVPDPLPLAELRAAAERWRRTELLLVRVQNVFYPGERGGPGRTRWTGGVIPGLTEDAAEWAIEQARTLDYGALAAECGVDADQLKEQYEQLVYTGLHIDPTSGVFELLDQVNRSSRERLRGDALRALDFYDAARILRSWHQRLTGGDPLPDVDEYRGPNSTEVKLRRYGTRDVRGNQAVLPILLEEHGLYPWRVQLIGEGASEIAALKVILAAGYGLSFERLGIAVTDMGGSDIPEKTEQLLASFRGYANYFLLVFDNEGRAEELIQTLMRAEVIEGPGEEQRKAIRKEAARAAKQVKDPHARATALRAALEEANSLTQAPGAAPEFVLWKDNFEADNFTVGELCQVIEAFALEIGLEGFALDADELNTKLQRAQQDEGKAIASTVLDAASDQDSRFFLSKPEFAERLARFALENPELQEGKRRPILELAEHLVQLTWADRRLAGMLRS